MSQAITGLLALIVLIASLAAVVVVTKSKRVEAGLKVLGELVDALTKGNVDLRATMAQREEQHQAEQVTTKAACDAALSEESETRKLENIACLRDLAILQGKVDVLTTNIADVIATAVLTAVAVRTAKEDAAAQQRANQGDGK